MPSQAKLPPTQSKQDDATEERVERHETVAVARDYCIVSYSLDKEGDKRID